MTLFAAICWTIAKGPNSPADRVTSPPDVPRTDVEPVFVESVEHAQVPPLEAEADRDHAVGHVTDAARPLQEFDFLDRMAVERLQVVPHVVSPGEVEVVLGGPDDRLRRVSRVPRDGKVVELLVVDLDRLLGTPALA
jgi:hypothetical protein